MQCLDYMKKQCGKKKAHAQPQAAAALMDRAKNECFESASTDTLDAVCRDSDFQRCSCSTVQGVAEVRVTFERREARGSAINLDALVLMIAARAR